MSASLIQNCFQDARYQQQTVFSVCCIRYHVRSLPFMCTAINLLLYVFIYICVYIYTHTHTHINRNVKTMSLRFMCILIHSEGKGKVRPRTGHEDRGGIEM